MRISDWSSDVCSSDLLPWIELAPFAAHGDDHQEWHAADIRQCQRVNDVADAAALQQQRAAPPTEPGAGEQADALLFGRQRDDRDLVVGLAQANELRMAGIRHMADLRNALGDRKSTRLTSSH